MKQILSQLKFMRYISHVGVKKFSGDTGAGTMIFCDHRISQKITKFGYKNVDNFQVFGLI